MSKTRSRETLIGSRLRLKDLHVFMAVARSGSMAKGADQLGISQPAISEVIAGLEHALRVKLFDRNPRGVELTAYGRALLNRGIAAFDELSRGLEEMEALADPGVGEVRIGCPDSLSSGFMPLLIREFKEKHPRVVLQVRSVSTLSLELPELRERSLDLVIARPQWVARPQEHDEASSLADDLNLETLFDDHVVIVAGLQSRWARRDRIGLEELVDEPWVMPDTRARSIVVEAYRARGLKAPNIGVVTNLLRLRAELAATGDYLTSLPASVLQLNADNLALKALPVDLPQRPFPLVLITLKNRTLGSAAVRFIEHVKVFSKPLAAALPRRGNAAREVQG
jgi:DNA-binding transcriptional LysR family regulator